MPRPLRICLPGLPHHVVQRGNDRRATFFRRADYLAYLDFLRKAATTQGTQVHAFVLMTNHVHLLMTPSTETGLSLTMQGLGRSYVNYINRIHQRSGTLWEGRFKSAVITTGETATERRREYCALVCESLTENELRTIRRGIKRGRIHGSDPCG